MRILASNPDTLGDFVLRQPMYRALREAGHELMLIVRGSVEPLVKQVAPGARTVVLPAEVYADDVDRHWEMFAETVRAARAFAPDVLLVAPYRWTLFEERLSATLPAEVRRIGMSGHLYAGDPHAGPARASAMRLDVVAEVREEQAEIEKNAALCAAVLGAPPYPIDPRLAADDAALAAAKQVLGGLGLEAGGYWVACVGGTAHVSIKTWPAEHWGRVLGEWVRRHGRRFLFVGLPDERPAADAVRRAMADAVGDEAAARHAALWLEPGSSIDDLLALTQLSAGYVGHDTGPMHVAAAMGKPVVAVFGGGTWPRFRPAVEPSVAVTVGVPCAGCGWACSFSTSHCIKQVPVGEVMRAALDMEEGRVAGRDCRVLEPGPALQAQMIREAAGYVRQQVREKASLGKQLLETQRGADAGWVAAVQVELEAAREAANHATRAAAERALETAQLRQDLEQRASESHRLAATLETQTREFNRLRAEVRGILQNVEQSNGIGTNGAGGAPAREPGGTGGGAAAHGHGGDPSGHGTDAAVADEVERLRAAIERLDARVRGLEPRVRPVRRPMRQVLTELVIGSKYYPRRPPLPYPRVTIVTPTLNAADTIRATVESVLAQNYHHLEYVVVDGGSTDGTLDVLREFGDRIDRIIAAPAAGAMDAVAKGFEAAEADVLSFLLSGDVLEPGGVMRVAEHFAEHRFVNAVYAEDAVVYPDGWKFPAPAQPRADVYHLLRLAARGRRFQNGVFFRRSAYDALGPLNVQLGRAADWELWVRLARRFGLRRLGGHVRSVRAERVVAADPAYAADLAKARAAFEPTFGAAGRVRCRVLDAAHRVFDTVRALSRRPRLFFPLAPDGGRGSKEAARPLPPGKAPAFVPGQPISPLTHRPADRLLFSTRDTTGGCDGTIRQVYYDSTADVALAYPPLPLDRLDAMYAAREARGEGVVSPDIANYRSPYAKVWGGVVGMLAQRLPSPYWWFRDPEFGDATADEVLLTLGGLVDPNDPNVRLLNVGCFDGSALDRIKSVTKWQTAGTETNARAAAKARAKGHLVWEVAAQDAPLALPVDQSFRVIFLANSIEHLPNPLHVLRRLRQLLEPGGVIVLNTPNLDSAHVRLFGPTWGHWQVPYHRTLMGRRGLRRMASLADLRVVKVRTRTLPYPACVSVQLNELGLGAVVPDTARFPNVIASRGVRLTGWSRLLWDWRGRGDFLFAAMKAL
jgi:ADP-heptose:LPS heptosyltransferase/SAM-dependent methyltransferase